MKDSTRRLGRSDLLLLLVALAAGAFFFGSLGRLWPLAATDLNVPPGLREARAREFLAGRGLSLEGFASASSLAVDAAALEYVERSFGRDRAQEWISEGLPLVSYRVAFKRAGDPDALGVTLHPARGVLGWTKEIEEDEPGVRLSLDEARLLARGALAGGLGLDLSAWEERSAASREAPARRDHTFIYERKVSEAPELRERAVATVAGAVVVSASRRLVVPAAASRGALTRQAPRQALQIVGVALALVAIVAAFIVFLLRLRDGSARLGPVSVWIAVLGATLLGAQLLETSQLFGSWQTLWPRWVSTLQSLVYQNAQAGWLLIVLLAVISAGEALDRQSGAGRSESLWALGAGRFFDAGVGAAAARGFLVGLLCGGALAAGVRLLELLGGARISIQPRGFFLPAINSASPSAWTLLFFLNVALAEELGYRLFGGTWILALTGRRWVAIVVPAIVYGLTHTDQSFLPPDEPFWCRPLVMTLVGCVWGWAFFRFDALTVVLSHFTADLFIFNWPKLASGDPWMTLSASATIAVPLVPAVGWGLRALIGRAGGEP